MEKIKDKQVILDGVIIPYCEEGGECWHPIRYTTEKFLLKGTPNLQTKDLYKPYIKRCIIDYSFTGTVPQETNCMNKEGWIKYLENCKSNKNRTLDKVKRHNLFCEYLNCENKKLIEWNEDNNLYDDYVKDCINAYEQEHDNIEYGTCSNCGRRLPLASGFFPPDDRVSKGFTSRCNMCKSSNYPIVHVDKYARMVYKLYGNDAYLLYMSNTTQFIEEYSMKRDFNELCLHTNITPFVKMAEKEALLNIVKNDYINNIIKENDLNVDFVSTNYKIKVKNSYLTNNEINEYCSNNDCNIRPWLYPCYKLGTIEFEKAKLIINIYLKDNNIVIDDIFNYQYNDLLKKCKLTQFNNNILDFVVKLYNYEYAGYKFKIASSNYYKDKENRIFDMKWLVEKDLKIDILKIPLYITKSLLGLNYKSLYYVLNKNYYNGSLFDWINECYPNKFIETDFDINPYRNIFDSFEEAQVDRILRNDCENVIYNIRNSDNEISVLDMKPDWIILSRKGTILVEYFGLYNHGGKEYKERLEIYKNKMDKKYIKYGELLKMGYKHLYIYPDDLKNEFEGLHKKLKVIK